VTLVGGLSPLLLGWGRSAPWRHSSEQR